MVRVVACHLHVAWLVALPDTAAAMAHSLCSCVCECANVLKLQATKMLRTSQGNQPDKDTRIRTQEDVVDVDDDADEVEDADEDEGEDAGKDKNAAPQ